MKKKLIAGIIAGVVVIALGGIGISTLTQTKEEAVNTTASVEETNDDTSSEEEVAEEENTTEEPSQSEKIEEVEQSAKDEESPDEMEDHESELQGHLDDIQLLAKSLASASGRTYDDTWNDVYNCAKTYGFEYAQNYANKEIAVAKSKASSGGSNNQDSILNHIDDWDYACLMYEYIPSSNMVGTKYTLETSKYGSYEEFYFSTSQQNRDELKSLFKGQCPSITGEDSWRFQSKIHGCGNELKEALKAAGMQ